jgi:hypothetical protein
MRRSRLFGAAVLRGRQIFSAAEKAAFSVASHSLRSPFFCVETHTHHPMACTKPASSCFSSCLSSAPGSNVWFSGSSASDPKVDETTHKCPGEFLGGQQTEQVHFAVGKTGRYVIPERLVSSGVTAAPLTSEPALGTPPAAPIDVANPPIFGGRVAHLIAAHNSTGIIVFDLSAISAAAVAANLPFAPADGGFAGVAADGLTIGQIYSVNPRLLPGVRVSVTNKGCYPAYVLVADKTACGVTIEGVFRSVGVRPRESITLLFDPALLRWCIVARSPQL